MRLAAGLWLAGCETDQSFSDLLSARRRPPASTRSLGTGRPTGRRQRSAAARAGRCAEPAGVLGSKAYDDLSIGKRYYRVGNFGMAERYFRQAVETHPRDAEAWLGLAAACDRLRRFDLADRAYGEAIKLVGPTVEILNNQGYSYMLRGDYARARTKLDAGARPRSGEPVRAEQPAPARHHRPHRQGGRVAASTGKPSTRWPVGTRLCPRVNMRISPGRGVDVGRGPSAPLLRKSTALSNSRPKGSADVTGRNGMSISKNKSGLSRRTLLKAGAAISVFPAPAVLAQSPEPLKIGFLTVLTGPLAAGGKQQEEGAALFLKERNGMIAGRKVELITQDTAGNPALAKTKLAGAGRALQGAGVDRPARHQRSAGDGRLRARHPRCR